MMLHFNSTLVHLGQKLLCLYSFGYSLSDDDLVKVETCERDVIIDEWLFIIGCAICFIKYYIFSLIHGIWVTLNIPLLSLCTHTHAHTYLTQNVQTHMFCDVTQCHQICFSRRFDTPQNT